MHRIESWNTWKDRSTD